MSLVEFTKVLMKHLNLNAYTPDTDVIKLYNSPVVPKAHMANYLDQVYFLREKRKACGLCFLSTWAMCFAIVTSVIFTVAAR